MSSHGRGGRHGGRSHGGRGYGRGRGYGYGGYGYGGYGGFGYGLGGYGLGVPVIGSVGYGIGEACAYDPYTGSTVCNDPLVPTFGAVRGFPGRRFY